MAAATTPLSVARRRERKKAPGHTLRFSDDEDGREDAESQEGANLDVFDFDGSQKRREVQSASKSAKKRARAGGASFKTELSSPGSATKPVRSSRPSFASPGFSQRRASFEPSRSHTTPTSSSKGKRASFPENDLDFFSMDFAPSQRRSGLSQPLSQIVGRLHKSSGKKRKEANLGELSGSKSKRGKQDRVPLSKQFTMATQAMSRSFAAHKQARAESPERYKDRPPPLPSSRGAINADIDEFGSDDELMMMVDEGGRGVSHLLLSPSADEGAHLEAIKPLMTQQHQPQPASQLPGVVASSSVISARRVLPRSSLADAIASMANGAEASSSSSSSSSTVGAAAADDALAGAATTPTKSRRTSWQHQLAEDAKNVTPFSRPQPTSKSSEKARRKRGKKGGVLCGQLHQALDRCEAEGNIILHRESTSARSLRPRTLTLSQESHVSTSTSALVSMGGTSVAEATTLLLRILEPLESETSALCICIATLCGPYDVLHPDSSSSSSSSSTSSSSSAAAEAAWEPSSALHRTHQVPLDSVCKVYFFAADYDRLKLGAGSYVRLYSSWTVHGSSAQRPLPVVSNTRVLASVKAAQGKSEEDMQLIRHFDSTQHLANTDMAAGGGKAALEKPPLARASSLVSVASLGSTGSPLEQSPGPEQWPAVTRISDLHTYSDLGSSACVEGVLQRVLPRGHMGSVQSLVQDVSSPELVHPAGWRWPALVLQEPSGAVALVEIDPAVLHQQGWFDLLAGAEGSLVSLRGLSMDTTATASLLEQREWRSLLAALSANGVDAAAARKAVVLRVQRDAQADVAARQPHIGEAVAPSLPENVCTLVQALELCLAGGERAQVAAQSQAQALAQAPAGTRASSVGRALTPADSGYRVTVECHVVKHLHSHKVSDSPRVLLTDESLRSRSKKSNGMHASTLVLELRHYEHCFRLCREWPGKALLCPVSVNWLPLFARSNLLKRTSPPAGTRLKARGLRMDYCPVSGELNLVADTFTDLSRASVQSPFDVAGFLAARDDLPRLPVHGSPQPLVSLSVHERAHGLFALNAKIVEVPNQMQDPQRTVCHKCTGTLSVRTAKDDEPAPAEAWCPSCERTVGVVPRYRVPVVAELVQHPGARVQLELGHDAVCALLAGVDAADGYDIFSDYSLRACLVGREVDSVCVRAGMQDECSRTHRHRIAACDGDSLQPSSAQACWRTL